MQTLTAAPAGQMIVTRILDAVDALLARYGYRKMTMDDLAHEAGVSKRTIYQYFTSKEEVALSSIDRVVTQVIDRLVEIADTPGSAERRLREMLIARVICRFDCIRDYYFSLDDLFAEIRPAYMERRGRYFSAEADVIAGVIEQGILEGRIVPADTQEMARALLYATNALLPSSLSVAELGSRDEIEARVTVIAQLLLDGLRTR